MQDNMRVIFHVRTMGKPDDITETRIMNRLQEAIDTLQGWAVLTIGRSYYHDNSLCNGHPDAEDKCNAS